MQHIGWPHKGAAWGMLHIDCCMLLSAVLCGIRQRLTLLAMLRFAGSCPRARQCLVGRKLITHAKCCASTKSVKLRNGAAAVATQMHCLHFMLLLCHPFAVCPVHSVVRQATVEHTLSLTDMTHKWPELRVPSRAQCVEVMYVVLGFDSGQ